MPITANQVKELRDRSGVGMMDCKKALVEADGNIDKAFDLLRKSGIAKAQKKAGRNAKDGNVISYIHPGSKLGVLLEINCETDFVAKDSSFIQFTEDVVTKLSLSFNNSLMDLLKGDLEEKREKLIQKLGENILVRRIAKSYKNSDFVGLYLHSNKKIACIVSLKGGSKNLARDIAMRSASSARRLARSSEDVIQSTPGVTYLQTSQQKSNN